MEIGTGCLQQQIMYVACCSTENFSIVPDDYDGGRAPSPYETFQRMPVDGTRDSFRICHLAGEHRTLFRAYGMRGVSVYWGRRHMLEQLCVLQRMQVNVT